MFTTEQNECLHGNSLLWAALQHYDKIILNSKNKMKITWNIIKSETGK